MRSKGEEIKNIRIRSSLKHFLNNQTKSSLTTLLAKFNLLLSNATQLVKLVSKSFSAFLKNVFSMSSIPVVQYTHPQLPSPSGYQTEITSSIPSSLLTTAPPPNPKAQCYLFLNLWKITCGNHFIFQLSPLTRKMPQVTLLPLIQLLLGFPKHTAGALLPFLPSHHSSTTYSICTSYFQNTVHVQFMLLKC